MPTAILSYIRSQSSITGDQGGAGDMNLVNYIVNLRRESSELLALQNIDEMKRISLHYLRLFWKNYKIPYVSICITSVLIFMKNENALYLTPSMMLFVTALSTIPIAIWWSGGLLSESNRESFLYSSSFDLNSYSVCLESMLIGRLCKRIAIAIIKMDRGMSNCNGSHGKPQIFTCCPKDCSLYKRWQLFQKLNPS